MPYSLQVSPTEPFYEKKLEYDHKFLADKKKKTQKKPGLVKVFVEKKFCYKFIYWLLLSNKDIFGNLSFRIFTFMQS